MAEITRNSQDQLYRLFTKVRQDERETDEVRELASYILDVYFD